MSKIIALLLSLCFAFFAGNAVATDVKAVSSDSFMVAALDNDVGGRSDFKSEFFEDDDDGFFIGDDDILFDDDAVFVRRNPFLFNDPFRNNLVRRELLLRRNNFFIRNPGIGDFRDD